MLILIAHCLTACESNQPEKQSAHELKNPFQFEGAKNISFDSNVPSGIGTLISKTYLDEKSSKYEFCNWVLIDKNMALTSSSCIPESLKSSDVKDCGNYLFGKFKTNSNETEAKCKKVLFASEIPEDNYFINDYALIELDRDIPDTDFHPLNRKGITNREEVTIMALSQSSGPGFSNRYFTSYNPTKCNIQSSDIFGKILSPGSSPVFGFKQDHHSFTHNCQPLNGKSGAAVITKDGSLIGLSNVVRDYQKMIPSDLRPSNKIAKDMTLISNLSCQKFNLDNLDSDISPTCINENVSDRIVIKDEQVEIEHHINKDLNKITTTLPKYFEYNHYAQKDANSFSISIQPTCIKPLSQWSESDRLKVTKYSTMRTAYKLAYSASYQMFVDLYGNYVVTRETIQDESAYRIIENMGEMETNNEIRLEIYDPGVLSPYTSYESIKVCKE